MALNPELRASDADRDRVAALLRENMAQGRLTADELEERLGVTYEARTLGDLLKITEDLPEEDVYQRPVPAYRRSSFGPPAAMAGRPPREVYRKSLAAGWAAWGSVSLVCTIIWLLTVVGGASLYPWPIWVAGPWGAILLAGTIFGPKPRE